MSSELWHYRAFGLHWQSALRLPELRDGPAIDVADVVVEIDFAPMPDASEVVQGVRAAPGIFWMETADIARFLVTDGRRIVVEPAPGAADGDIRAYLLGSVVGALLHQRGSLPLHASVIELDGKAVAFVAPSGGGKSTIAMHIHHLGHRVIADDLCAVEMVDGRAMLSPGLRNLKLWRGSLEAIDRAPDGFEPVLEAMDKYRVPIDALADDRAFELAAVIRLDWSEATALTPLGGAEAVCVLIANTFRGQLVSAMERDAVHWRQCLEVFRACRVFNLARPHALARLDEASRLIVERFAGMP